VIITEEELAQCGQLLSLDDVRNVPEVQLGERAMRAVRRKERRKAKKK
jgi:hypothetical protein